MSWYNYRFRTLVALKEFKKSGYPLIKGDLYSQVDDELLSDGGHSAMELYWFQEENEALRSKPEFLFIDNLETLSLIKKCRFASDAVTLDEGVSFISFPKGSKINGLPINGVMIGNGTEEKRRMWNNHFYADIGRTPRPYATDGKDGYLSLSYQNPTNRLMHCRLNIPIDRIPAVISAETSDELYEAINRITFGYGLDDVELDYQRQVAQLILKALVYKQASGNVRDGVPDKKATPRKVNIKGSVVFSPSKVFESGQQYTTVGLHFRNLLHDKYYKGEHAGKKKGTRWVQVNPYAKGIKAETLEA